jgi:hypothetical protein
MARKASWFSLFFVLLLAGCEKYPLLLSLHNYQEAGEKQRVALQVKYLPAPAITGDWQGLKHKLSIFDLSFRDTANKDYTVLLTYTFASVDHTAQYNIRFLNIAGKRYIEAAESETTNPYSVLPAAGCYLKLNRISEDTIIYQVMDGLYAQKWMKAKGYHYIPYTGYRAEKSKPVYLTENLQKQTALLKAIYDIPQAFRPADTITRIRLK